MFAFRPFGNLFALRPIRSVLVLRPLGGLPILRLLRLVLVPELFRLLLFLALGPVLALALGPVLALALRLVLVLALRLLLVLVLRPALVPRSLGLLLTLQLVRLIFAPCLVGLLLVLWLLRIAFALWPLGLTLALRPCDLVLVLRPLGPALVLRLLGLIRLLRPLGLLLAGRLLGGFLNRWLLGLGFALWLGVVLALRLFGLVLVFWLEPCLLLRLLSPQVTSPALVLVLPFVLIGPAAFVRRSIRRVFGLAWARAVRVCRGLPAVSGLGVVAFSRSLAGRADVVDPIGLGLRRLIPGGTVMISRRGARFSCLGSALPLDVLLPVGAGTVRLPVVFNHRAGEHLFPIATVGGSSPSVSLAWLIGTFSGLLRNGTPGLAGHRAFADRTST